MPIRLLTRREPDNVSTTLWAWTDQWFAPMEYLYDVTNNATVSAVPCRYTKRDNVSLDVPVGPNHTDVLAVTLQEAESTCTANPACTGVLIVPEGGPPPCVMGDKCFVLRGGPPRAGGPFTTWVSSCHKPAPPPAAPVAGRGKTPPNGVRSSLPLGGLGAGTFELRADGSLQEWTISNESPAGSAKLPPAATNDAYFALSVQTGARTPVARALRTSPPRGLPAVEALGYEATYPVGRMSIMDAELLQGLSAELYQTSDVQPVNASRSNTPSASFVLRVSNPTTHSANVSMLLSLPLGAQRDYDRPCGGDNLGLGPMTQTRATVPTSNHTACMHTCGADKLCDSWVYDASLHICTLCHGVPSGAWSGTWGGPGNWTLRERTSGVLGAWTSAQRSLGYTTRNHLFPQAGSFSMQWAAEGPATLAFAVGEGPEELFKTWQSGRMAPSLDGEVQATHGATAMRMVVAAGETRTVSLTVGWFFPNHDFNHYRVGNAYNNMHTSAAEVAEASSGSLQHLLNTTARWHSSFTNSSLPSWLADTLVNTLSTWRTGMFFKDRTWRQWETYDCVDTDPVECDSSRSLPLLVMFPDLFADLLRGWAKSQCGKQDGPSWWHLCTGDGQISESIAEACGLASQGAPDIAGGRLQGDATTVFSFYVYHLHRWTNDTKLLEELWPNVKRAVSFTIAEAHSNATNRTALPYRMDPMWDILALASIDYVFYNSVWYVVSLMAAEQLAMIMGDGSMARACRAEAAAARDRIDETFWVETEQRWRPINDSSLRSAGIGDGLPNWTMADDFLSQVHATTAGLPMALNESRMRTHLAHGRASNLSPQFGMRALTCATPDMQPCDHDPAYRHVHGFGPASPEGAVAELYRAAARPAQYRRGSIGMSRYGVHTKEPVTQPEHCGADPYMGVLTDMTVVGMPPLANMMGSNISACQQQCCDWAAAHNGSHACVAATLTAASKRCSLFSDPSRTEAAAITPADGQDLAFVMWRTPTPGDCPRMSGDPATCSRFANANCEVLGEQCLNTHPPSVCGTAQASTMFQHGDHDSVWGMTTPDYATNALRSGAENVSQALGALQGYLDNTRVGQRDQWNWPAVTATETTGGGPGGQPWCSSHYFFHLSVWHVPLAVSGQDYSAVSGRLSFAPKLGLPLSLPVLVANGIGTLRLASDGGGSLQITAGSLRLRALAVDGEVRWSAAEVRVLGVGQQVQW
jgi:hypothetical protein